MDAGPVPVALFRAELARLAREAVADERAELIELVALSRAELALASREESSEAADPVAELRAEPADSVALAMADPAESVALAIADPAEPVMVTKPVVSRMVESPETEVATRGDVTTTPPEGSEAEGRVARAELKTGRAPVETAPLADATRPAQNEVPKAMTVAASEALGHAWLEQSRTP